LYRRRLAGAFELWLRRSCAKIEKQVQKRRPEAGGTKTKAVAFLLLGNKNVSRSRHTYKIKERVLSSPRFATPRT
jgi:hypothetical protein